MNSRWSTHPIKRGGEIVSIRPNVAGDTEILKCLARYGVLDAQTIAAITQRSYGSIIYRLNLLKRSPNKLIKVHDTQLQTPRIYQWSPQVFELTDAGAGKIGVELIRSNKHFLHTITESQVEASFEIGARARLERDVMPSKVSDYSFPVSFNHRNKQWNYRLVPDGRPFAITYQNNLYRFFALEVDLNSEQIRWHDSQRQTIERKFLAYLDVLENRIYQSHLGFPNLTVLFTTTTAARMNSMMRVLIETTPQHLSRYLRCFAFAHFSSILGDTPQPTDRGWAFNQPWLQCGGTTLNLGDVNG